ncbi:MAG TPA: hypothetical protein VL860_06820 [Planctomycetota bacterium]|nr:hypothetical protein [Planctomycetota bacterium]
MALITGFGLVLTGCGDGPSGPQPEGMLLRLAPAQTANEMGAPAVASLWVPKSPGYELKEQQSTADFSKLVFVYKDKNGRDAALLLVAVAFGEADQPLPEKFATLLKEDEDAVKHADAFKPLGPLAPFTTQDGLSGLSGVFRFPGVPSPQIKAIGLLDLRKKDAVYVRVQLLTPEVNWKILENQFNDFLKQLKRSAP